MKRSQFSKALKRNIWRGTKKPLPTNPTKPSKTPTPQTQNRCPVPRASTPGFGALPPRVSRTPREGSGSWSVLPGQGWGWGCAPGSACSGDENSRGTERGAPRRRQGPGSPAARPASRRLARGGQVGSGAAALSHRGAGSTGQGQAQQPGKVGREQRERRPGRAGQRPAGPGRGHRGTHPPAPPRPAHQTAP